MCHFNDPNFTISVDVDYKVTTILSNEIQKQYSELVLRKYNTTDYHIKNDAIDKSFFKQAAEAFKKDTGVDIGLLLSLMEYMQLDIIEDGAARTVIQMFLSKEELENMFLDLLKKRNTN